MTKYYITLEKNGFKYSIFVLGYDKGGGYFISDLSKENKKYFITSLRLKLKGFGQQAVPIDHKNEWIVHFKPKLMCHYDGSCQISGTGIRSGFYKLNGKPKGVATNSPRFNDGGPIFGFVCWGLDKFPINKNKKLIIFDPISIHVDPYLGHKRGLDKVKYDAFVFEGFYLPRQAVKYLNIVTGIIYFKHPNFGLIPLKYIPPPKNSPGFIAIGCRPTGREFNTDHGFTYGGGVSLPDKEGYITQIQIVFPGENVGQCQNNKKLDFNYKDKIVSILDNLIFWLKNKIRQ